MYDWKNWRTLFPLIISLFGMIIFVSTSPLAICLHSDQQQVFYSKYFALEPLIKGSIFDKSTAKAGYFGTFIHGVIVWSLLYYMPLYYEVAKNFSPIESGVAIFPLTFTIAPAAVVVGLVITKTGRYRPSIVCFHIHTLNPSHLTTLYLDAQLTLRP
jgi:hypothetical protein